jgi:transcriptional regulator with XRE-family HTH domain
MGFWQKLRARRRAYTLVDTPLRRRRLQMGLTQEDLAERCHIHKRSLARYEQAKRNVTRSAQLQCLMRETGLPVEALVLPVEYLQAHQDFLIEYALPERGIGRPRKDGPSDPMTS